MDLTTRYLGFTLPHPIVPGASPLADNIDDVRRLEDAGAPMIIMRSLFEEQIQQETEQILNEFECTLDHDAEVRSMFPEPLRWNLGPHEYLAQLQRIKEAVKVPVVASLNGTSPGGWLRYARQIEQAGADALELNIYFLATDPLTSGADIDNSVISIVENVCKMVKIPVAVKLSPFFSSLPNLAARLDAAGASALVIFNRFYQPDINVIDLEVEPTLHLSTSEELLLRLRWCGILSGRTRANLAITGGVHTPLDVVKSLMSGARIVQVVSALLQNGPLHIATLQQGLKQWMEMQEYESVSQMIGSMSLARTPRPDQFERANYARVLQTWRS